MNHQDKNTKDGLPDPQAAVHDAKLDASCKRFVEHHTTAGSAFYHSVIAAIEILNLRLEAQHGEFAALAEKHFPAVATRTIRYYRRMGEYYLSAVHARVMTAEELKQLDETARGEHCTDDAVQSYVRANGLLHADDLRKLAEAKVPGLTTPKTKRTKRRVDAIMYKVKRAWSRMTPEQQADFQRRFKALRAKPPEGASDHGNDSATGDPPAPA